jgi:hypothetical protein
MTGDLARAAESSILPADPAPPASLGATGLSESLLIDLLGRHLLRAGVLQAGDLARRLGVPMSVVEPTLQFLRVEKLLEVPRRGNFDADVVYGLTDAGRSMAHQSMEKCAYVGPMPVTLDDYVARVRAQSARGGRVDRAAVRRAFGDAVVSDDVVTQFGSAANSGKALYLYGPSGTGKTFLAERLVRVMTDAVWVPHAVFIDGEIVQVFDPLVHRPLAPGDEPHRPVLAKPPEADRRWVRTHRPVVITGGELTLSMLDLQFEQHARFYVAPPQVKANNGMMIIDDLGRQRVSAREILNRWIVPLDRGLDYLALHTGAKFQVPFDVGVVFSSNLSPATLGDPAFARRLGYKIHLGALDESGYREVFRQACRRSAIAHDEAMADFLIHALHRVNGIGLYATIPYDIVSKLRDRAAFQGTAAGLDIDGLRWAWDLYFAPDDGEGGRSSLDETR